MSETIKKLECFMYWLNENILFNENAIYDIIINDVNKVITYNDICNLLIEIDENTAYLYDVNYNVISAFLIESLLDVDNKDNSYKLYLDNGQTITVKLQ